MGLSDRIRNAPIQRKLLLIIFATLLVSLVLVLLGIVLYELRVYRSRLARETTDLAGFIAANSAPPLAFDDAKTAGEILATLESSPTIVAAFLYTTDGRVFASYTRSDQTAFVPPLSPGPPRREFGFGHMELVRSVQQKGLPLGMLYLRADLATLYARLKNYGGIALLVSIATGAGSLMLQRMLRRLVSEPLFELSGMAERIAGGDLTATVPVRSGDEIGRLAGALNRMSSELEQSYRDLQENRARMAGIVETALDAIITTDAEGRILHFNTAAERMFGCPAADAIGGFLARFIPGPMFRAGAEKLTVSDELKGVRQSGEAFPVEASLSSLESSQGRLVTVILRDITERKKGEQALLASEHRLRRAEEIAHFGYWRYEAASDHFTWSDETYRIHGVRPELFQHTLASYLELVHQDDREPFRKAITQGQSDLQFRIVRPNGVLRYLTATSEVQRDDSGMFTELFGTFLDSTELRQAERELQEKNAELERFTYTVSHDLKSPLVTVKSFLGYLEQDMAGLDQERIAKDIFYIKSAAEKMGVLLDELLEMSRIGRTINPPVQVTFGELVEEALLAVAGGLTERGVEVQVTGEVTLYGDRPRLIEIWQNLVENAVKFMGEQPSPRIEIGLESVAGEQVFYVCDNGIGIDPRYIEKIFGLFEKLDPKSKGTGLGLALVRRIVQLYQGKIWVESGGGGRGACFRFTLPAALQQAALHQETTGD